MRLSSWLVALSALMLVACEGDFPPPPLPKSPPHFNIHCDVCRTMMNRVVPYCQREEQNNDYLPDFCVFNYNQVLRTECDYIVDVMEYAWCPDACEQARRLKSFSADKICHHPLVNCTERHVQASPSPSPSPSPSTPIPPDCMLCQYVLKHVALMCMNEEPVNKKNIYHLCMEKTHSHVEFDHCQTFLGELVALAGTTSPCELVSCEDPRVMCAKMPGEEACHVVEYDGGAVPEFSKFGLDDSGNLQEPASSLASTVGLGPGDFKPGQKPYHSLIPGGYHTPRRVRVAGHLWSDAKPSKPTTEAEAKVAEVDEASRVLKENVVIVAEPEPQPVTIRDVSMN